MSDTQTDPNVAAEDNVVLPEISIKRNSVDLTLSPMKIVKGPNKGKKYLAPSVRVENLENLINWFGRETVVNVLLKYSKSVFQGIWLDAIDEATGEFLREKFVKEAENCTNAGLKLKEINDQLDVFYGEQLELSNSELDANGQFSPEVSGKMRKLRDEIAAYRAMAAEKSRKTKPEVEAEAAVEVK